MSFSHSGRFPMTSRQQRRIARRMGIAALLMLRSLPLGVVAGLGRFTKQCAALALIASAMISRSSEPARAEFGEIAAEGDIINLSESGDSVGNTAVAMAMDADGNFVVVWESNGIVARRFNSSGAAQGAIFDVSTSNVGTLDVAMDDDGDFVVVWQGTDADYEGIFMQRYDASGVAQGGETAVNTTTLGYQRSPSVAMDADGDFAVVWTSYYFDSEVFAQRYNAAGVAQGGEFQVNTYTNDIQRFPDVAMDDDGNFAVVWESGEQISAYDIFTQRYDASGVAQGAETQVNTETGATQRQSRIDMDADGDFVVVWKSLDGIDTVRGQRFDAAGAAQGAEFQVSSTDNPEDAPEGTDVIINLNVAMDSNGDFVVTWSAEGYPVGSSDYHFILARRYNASGEVTDDETVVRATANDFTLGTPAVAIHPDGESHVIVWQEYDDDNSEEDIFAQRFISTPIVEEEEEAPPPDTSADGQLESSIEMTFSEGSAGSGSGGIGVTTFVNNKGLQAKLKIRNTRGTPIRIGVIIIKAPKQYHNIRLTSSSITSSGSASLTSASMIEVEAHAVSSRVSEGFEARTAQASFAMSVESDDNHLYIHSVDLDPGDAFDFGFVADGDAEGSATVLLTVKAEGGEVTQEFQLSQLSDGGGGCALDRGEGNRPMLPLAGGLLALLGGWYSRRRRRHA